MADKKRVRRTIKELQRVKTWQLFVLLVLAVLLAATFLRLNNVGMVQRRNAVAAADKAGNASTIKARLYDLQRYASTHMNAGTGQFYLTDQYQRDVQATIKASSSDTNPNKNVHEEAAKVCDPQFPYWSEAYVQCFVAELNKHPGSSEDLNKLNLPKPDLYRYAYSSPFWSPDFAGFSVLICLAIVLIILGRLVSLMILRALLRRHYSSI